MGLLIQLALKSVRGDDAEKGLKKIQSQFTRWIYSFRK